MKKNAQFKLAFFAMVRFKSLVLQKRLHCLALIKVIVHYILSKESRYATLIFVILYMIDWTLVK